MTLANQLTVFRILLIPIFVLLLVYDARIAALAVFLLTCLSDGLDGYIARTWQQQTTLGTYLDPIADKLLMITTYGTLALLNALPVSLTILLIVRDVTLSLFVGFVLLVSGRRLAGPTPLGRAAMFAQMTTVVAGLVFYVFEDQPLFHTVSPFVLMPIFIATAVLAVAAGVHYIFELTKLLQGVEQPVEPQMPVQ